MAWIFAAKLTLWNSFLLLGLRHLSTKLFATTYSSTFLQLGILTDFIYPRHFVLKRHCMTMGEGISVNVEI